MCVCVCVFTECSKRESIGCQVRITKKKKRNKMIHRIDDRLYSRCLYQFGIWTWAKLTAEDHLVSFFITFCLTANCSLYFLWYSREQLYLSEFGSRSEWEHDHHHPGVNSSVDLILSFQDRPQQSTASLWEKFMPITWINGLAGCSV